MPSIITRLSALMTLAGDNLPLTGFAKAGWERPDEEALGMRWTGVGRQVPVFVRFFQFVLRFIVN
jgi:hypothetical protein